MIMSVNCYDNGSSLYEKLTGHMVIRYGGNRAVTLDDRPAMMASICARAGLTGRGESMSCYVVVSVIKALLDMMETIPA